VKNDPKFVGHSEAKPKNLEDREILHFVQDDKPYSPVTLQRIKDNPVRE
jgi:hypothetical protein